MVTVVKILPFPKIIAFAQSILRETSDEHLSAYDFNEVSVASRIFLCFVKDRSYKDKSW